MIRQEVVILAPAEAIAGGSRRLPRRRRARTAHAGCGRLRRRAGALHWAISCRMTCEWAIAPRESARLVFLSLLREYAAAQEQTDREVAIADLERLVAAEPADEAAHVAIMCLHATRPAAGRAAQFGQLRTAVKQVLDAEPEAASQQLYAAILAGRVDGRGEGRREKGGTRNQPGRGIRPAATTCCSGARGRSRRSGRSWRRRGW
ncbi:MAG: bacterial transcriptional activator domain-containing protein [Chloroflexia bacterium]